MKRRMIATFRTSRVLRFTTSVVIAGHIIAATPVLAQDLAQATVKASAQAAKDVTRVVERGADRTVRKGRRLASDAQRNLRKASVRVNRTVPKVTPPIIGCYERRIPRESGGAGAIQAQLGGVYSYNEATRRS
jgi:hypothetical protein